ncbi:MAG: ATP-dependent helicase DinG, partial [Frankiales bacterium]|nr:ATP-dependent helicase DinG [Frankiales bacterium]
MRAVRATELLDVALQAVPGAQAREGQHLMAEAVETALRTGEHLLVQAGTGTGKSLGYLVPAIASGKRVVVATATKALQAQLIDKDLPRLADALEKVLGRRPTYALAKGRSNYACLQQVHQGPGAREPEEQDTLWEGPTSMMGQQVVKLREWAAQAVTGDRDEVPFPVNDRVWRQISVTARECLGTKCPDRLECFAEKARELAKEADVVVANHALLAVATFGGVPVLPEHDAVVLDEAHEFVSSATDALTAEVSGSSARRAAAAAKSYLQPTTAERLDDAAKVLEGVLSGTLPGWIPALPAHLVDALGVVASVFALAATEVGGQKEEDEVSQARRDQVRNGLTEVAEAAGEMREPAVQSAVYATTDKVLRVSPLWVGGAVADRLFGESTVIATSATLTLGGSFAHTARELGLKRADGAEHGAPGKAGWRWLDVGSPFDYGRQGQLYVARDLPDPGKQPAAWQAAVDDLCAELVQAAGGRTLALFSSTAAAARAAAAVRDKTDVPVLLQGEDSPGALTHQFAADARTCLFGTRSFWQGVDVPGSACQLVILDRIPFPHVDDPLMKARLADAGERGFMDVTLPPAAVLLAQGAGRLIRSTTDRGVVVVLDPRLATARYGEVLLRTLPGFYPARTLEGVLASLRAIDASAEPVREVGPAPAERRRRA